MKGFQSGLLKFNAPEYLTAYFLASLAYNLLLFEQSQLASRAGQQVNIPLLVSTQEAFLTVLVLAVAFTGAARGAWRWLYVGASVLFAGYAGLSMISRFTATLELVPLLTSNGVPISDYQGSFYILALIAAISYLLVILILRRSYGKLVSVRGLGIQQGSS